MQQGAGRGRVEGDRDSGRIAAAGCNEGGEPGLVVRDEKEDEALLSFGGDVGNGAGAPAEHGHVDRASCAVAHAAARASTCPWQGRGAQWRR